MTLYDKNGFFQQGAIILEKDFETALKKNAQANKIDIAALEKEAEELSPSRPVQANWIALKLQKDHPEFIPSFVKELVTQAKNILDITPHHDRPVTAKTNETALPSARPVVTNIKIQEKIPDIVYERAIKPGDLPF